MIGYSPAVWFTDAFDYVGVAERMQPSPIRPSGYSFVLWIMRPLHSFAAVTAVQHVMGLAMGVMVYTLIRRRLPKMSSGWAVAAAAPVLLDAYQIFFEHALLSDVFFSFLLMATVTILLWSPGLSPARAVSTGLLLAMATLTRSVALAILPLVAGFVVVNRYGWRRFLATLAAAAIPLGGYAMWYRSWHGSPSLNGGTGIWLWARTMPFADCAKIAPPAEEAVLCPTQSRDRRPDSPHFIWSDWSPLRKVPGHPITFPADMFHPEINELAGGFASRAIRSQPLDYLGVVAWDLGRTLAWRRGPSPEVPVIYNYYAFPDAHGPFPKETRISGGSIRHDLWAYEQGSAATRVVEPAAGLMRTYQTLVYLPGTVFGILLVGAVVGVARARGDSRRQAALPLVLAVALVVVPVSTTAYDSRYWLPAIPLLSLALAILANDRVASGSAINPCRERGGAGLRRGRAWSLRALRDGGSDRREPAPWRE